MTSHPPTFPRDGRPRDLTARRQLARDPVASLRRRQPPVPRPAGPSGPLTLLRMMRPEPGTEVFGSIAEVPADRAGRRMH
jgi:hypothetical protein